MGYALEGIKVVDFGQFIAGPIAARLLGDLGAEVIKVEPNDGESLRPSRRNLDAFAKTFQHANAGKRGIALDLQKSEGVEIAHRLLAEADVVLNNFRPGVADRLGVGYEDAKKLNPKVIYVSCPGYGSIGPRRDKPGFEPLYSTFCGVERNSGGKGNPPSRATSFDQYAGLLCANAILMALYHRDISGESQHVEVTQLAQVLYYTSEVAIKENGEMIWDPALDSEQTGYHALERLYQTLDDWVCVGCWEDSEWEALCRAIELDEFLSDPKFDSLEKRLQNTDELATRIQEQFLTKTTSEWMDLLEDHQVPFEIPMMDGEDLILVNDENIESGLVAEHVHPIWGKLRSPGIGVRLSETPGVNRRPSPLLGQHSREILGEIGYTLEEITAFRDQGVVIWNEGDQAP